MEGTEIPSKEFLDMTLKQGLPDWQIRLLVERKDVKYKCTKLQETINGNELKLTAKE